MNNLCNLYELNTPLKINENDFSVASKMQSILKEFSAIYANKIQRVSEMGLHKEEDISKEIISILKSWVADLSEQNETLVSTVEELEKEASRRVEMIQEKIDEMCPLTKNQCQSLRDQQEHIIEILDQKEEAEKDAANMRKKVLSIQSSNVSLQKENSELVEDIVRLAEFIAKVQIFGEVEIDDPRIAYIISKNVSKEKSELLSLQKPTLRKNINRDTKTRIERNLLCKDHDYPQLFTEIVNRDKHITELQTELAEIKGKLKEGEDTINKYKVTEKEINKLAYNKLKELKEQFDEEELSNDTEEENQLAINIDAITKLLSVYSSENEELRKKCHIIDNNSSQQNNETRTLSSLKQNAINSEMMQHYQSFPSSPKRAHRCDNEVVEKNILIRDLQVHLASARTEVQLKDEVIQNIEKKLGIARSDVETRDERGQYLSCQLTRLQLEVSKLHGTNQQLMSQVSKQSEVMKKLENENTSLCHQLHNKCVGLESAHKQSIINSSEVDKKKKENYEQKLTIAALQENLVQTKQMCDQLSPIEDAKKTKAESLLSNGLLLRDNSIVTNGVSHKGRKPIGAVHHV